MKCKTHLKIDTDLTCDGCGAAFCSDCLLSVRNAHFCQECANEFVEKHGNLLEKKIQRDKEREQALTRKQEFSSKSANHTSASSNTGCGCLVVVLLFLSMIALSTLI